MRTIVALTDEQIQALADVCQRESISRSEAVRRAVDAFVKERPQARMEDYFGLWRDRPVDGVEVQRRLREEWDA